MHVFLTPFSQITTLVMAAVCIAAMTFGRWPERAAGAVVAIDWLASAALQDRRWRHHGQPATFTLDLVMLVFFVGLALGCRRTWVLWAAACVLLLDATHIAALSDSRIGQWSYITSIYVWELSLLVALTVGTLVEGRAPAGPLRLMIPTRMA